MSPLIQSQRSLLAPAWAGYPNQLWRRAQAKPSLDLRFAENKSLVDATTGQNLITFTRASSGTYVDSQGVIQTATTNLLLRSEDYSTSWFTSNVTRTGNTTDVTAPNGQNTASKLVVATSGALGQGLTSTAVPHTASIYLRTDSGSTTVDLLLYKSSPFQLVQSTTVAVTSAWQRFAITGTFVDTTSHNFQVNFGSNKTVYVWGAQLEQSSTVGEYIPTTSTINSAPRFDHNPTTGESLGLLVEEQRTNLLLRSEEFNNASWAKDFTTATADAAVAPNGTTTADKVAEDSSNNFHAISQYVSGFASGAIATLSIYAKADGRTRFRIQTDAAGGTGTVDFDLSAGTATAGTGVFSNGSISNVGNSWFRCSVRCTTSGAGAIGLKIILAQTTYGTAYTGDGTSGVYLWGAQLEAGAFPTSYIPTTTAAVTRSADVASITGTNFSSWYRQDEGTVFASATTNARYAGSNTFPRIVSISDGTTSNRIDLYYRVLSAYTDAGYSVAVSSIAQAGFDTNNERNGQSVAASYAINNFAFAAGGTLANTDNSGTVPAVDRMSLGLRSGIDLPYNGTIRRLTYWPSRLPSATMQQITQ